MNDDDPQWMDALAGRESADSPTRREALVLREALRTAGAPAAHAPAFDPRRERALLDRAAREGLLPARARQARWPLALAAGVVVALGLGFALHTLEPSKPLIERGAEDGVVRITVADPAALKQTLLRELRAAGAEATGYEALDVQGIDAELPLPLSEAIRQVLRAHDIPEPDDGVLRIEIRSAD